jgi:hypothetical protein
MNSPCQSFFFFFLILGLVLNNSATELSRRIMRLNFGHWFACEWLDSEFLMSLCFAESPGFWTVLRCIARCLFTLFPVCVLLGASCCKLSKDQLLGFLVSPLGIYREQFFFFFYGNYQRTTFWQNDTFTSISMQVEEHWCTIMS